MYCFTSLMRFIIYKAWSTQYVTDATEGTVPDRARNHIVRYCRNHSGLVDTRCDQQGRAPALKLPDSAALPIGCDLLPTPVKEYEYPDSGFPKHVGGK